jgi:hypothetical protein
VLAAMALLLFAALPAIFLARDSDSDPVFADLDRLNLPEWAGQSHEDHSSGSRWCLETCRLRERIWRSNRPAKETGEVYQRALVEAGWRPWTASDCPTGRTGVYTCWQRDGYVLDLWARDAPCSLGNVAPAPSTDPSKVAVPSPDATGPPPTCDGSLVTAKATDAADRRIWHR